LTFVGFFAWFGFLGNKNGMPKHTVSDWRQTPQNLDILWGFWYNYARGDDL